MGDVGRNFLGPRVHKRLGGVAEGAGGVDDVVEHDQPAAGDVADDVGDLGLAGRGTALVDDGQAHLQAAGQRQGPDHAAHVRRDDQQVVRHRIVFLDVDRHQRRGLEVVGGDVEEALDLARVQIHGQDPVGPGAGDQVGDQLGGNRGAPADLPVLAGIAEIGGDGGDPAGRRALERIDNHQQFHEVVVGGIAGRLDHEDVLAADVLVDGDPGLVVGEPFHLRPRERQVQGLGDGFGEGSIGVASQQLHRAVP